MKQFTLLFTMLIIFTTSNAQLDMGTHLILGYGVGSTGIKNAYSTSSNSQGTTAPPKDYLNDRFNHSSWMFKVSKWTEDYYVDNEVSIFMSAIPGIWSIGEKYNKTYLPNSGKLRKIDENTGKDNAEGIGLNAPIFMIDMAAGGSGWYGGLIWEYSLWGVTDVVGGSIAYNEEQNVIQHLGLSIKKSFDSPFGPTLASLEVNRLSKLIDGQPHIRRKGLESVLSVRAYTDADNGAFKGLYAEAYYRLQISNTKQL